MNNSYSAQPRLLTLRGHWVIALVAVMTLCGRPAGVHAEEYYEPLPPGTPGANLHPILPGQAVQQTSRFIDLVSRRLRTNAPGPAAVYGATVPPGAPMLLGSLSTDSSIQRIGLSDGGDFVVRAQGAALPAYGPGFATFGPMPAYAPNLGSVWASGFGLSGDVETDPVARGYDYLMTGTAFGVEQYLTPVLLAGLVGGFSNAHVDLNAPHADADIDSYYAGVYGQFTEGIFYASGVAAWGYQHYDTTRVIPADAETARANYKGNELATYIEKGLNLSFAGLRVQPLIGLQYIWLERDSFREKGAPMNNITAIEDHVDSLRLSVGGRLAPEVPYGFWGAIVPELRGRWVHEFLDDNQVMGAFVGGVPGNIIVSSPELGRNFGIVGVGINAQLSPMVNLYLDYDYQFSSSLESHAGSGGLELLW